jgi:hypothetical protein
MLPRMIQMVVAVVYFIVADPNSVAVYMRGVRVSGLVPEIPPLLWHRPLLGRPSSRM